MLPGMELMGCTDLAVPAEVMHHVVGVEFESTEQLAILGLKAPPLPDKPRYAPGTLVG